MSKRILFIHQKSHIGGGQTYITQLFKQSKKRNQKCFLIQDKTSWQIILKILKYKPSHIVWAIYSNFSLFPYFFSVLLGKKNYVLNYGVWSKEVPKINLEMNLKSIKENYYHLRYFVYASTNQFIINYLADYNLHLSKYAKNLFLSSPLLKKLKNKQHLIIYGGADKKIFHLKTKNKTKKNKSLILLMVGRIEERKNYLDGIKILEKINNSTDYQVTLKFAFSTGSFNEYDYLNKISNYINKKKLAKNIKFYFGLNRKEIAQLYQNCDAFLMLSTNLETFGLVTLEAIQSGAAVFAYNTCASPEIISDSQNIFLSNSNPQDLSKKIIEFNRMKNCEKKRHLNEIRNNIKKFSWKKTFEKMNI